MQLFASSSDLRPRGPDQPVELPDGAQVRQWPDRPRDGNGIERTSRYLPTGRETGPIRGVLGRARDTDLVAARARRYRAIGAMNTCALNWIVQTWRTLTADAMAHPQSAGKAGA